MSQRLDITHTLSNLYLKNGAGRGVLYPCPESGATYKANDFKGYTWWHLNFLQDHCYLVSRQLKANFSEHGIRRVEAPCARVGSRFTQIFKQAVMSLFHEIPVNAVAYNIQVAYTRMWFFVHRYVSKAITALAPKSHTVIGLDEEVSMRGYNFITVFIGLDRSDKPVSFATPDKVKECQSKSPPGPVRGALASIKMHLSRILHRWHSLHARARLEGLNGPFQAARARANGSKCREFHHHALFGCGSDSGCSGFLNSTSNVEGPNGF